MEALNKSITIDPKKVPSVKIIASMLNINFSPEDIVAHHPHANYDKDGLSILAKSKPLAAELIVWNLSEYQFFATVRKAIND